MENYQVAISLGSSGFEGGSRSIIAQMLLAVRIVSYFHPRPVCRRIPFDPRESLSRHGSVRSETTCPSFARCCTQYLFYLRSQR